MTLTFRTLFWSVAMLAMGGSALAQNGPTPQQLERAVKELRAWADRGDADAQFELGLRLITGEGIGKDEETGVGYVTDAAEQGHLRAMHVLGSLYEDGTVVKKDPAKAFEWFLKAAESGFPMAQFSVGVAYELGDSVKKDPKKATEWFKKAASQNFPPAMAAYASKLEQGDGVKKDTAKAALYYLKAGQQDYTPAMSRMAYMYYTGRGVPVDYRRSFGWYQRAARGGDPWAANDLAWFLSTCPDEGLHNGEQAVMIAKEALKLMAESGEDQRHEMLDTMAAALARNGEFIEAVLWQKKAISLLVDDEQEEDPETREKLTVEFEDRLKLYKKQVPYTEKEPDGDPEALPLPQDQILKQEGIPEAPPTPKKKKDEKKRKGTVV